MVGHSDTRGDQYPGIVGVVDYQQPRPVTVVEQGPQQVCGADGSAAPCPVELIGGSPQRRGNQPHPGGKSGRRGCRYPPHRHVVGCTTGQLQGDSSLTRAAHARQNVKLSIRTTQGQGQQVQQRVPAMNRMVKLTDWRADRHGLRRRRRRSRQGKRCWFRAETLLQQFPRDLRQVARVPHGQALLDAKPVREGVRRTCPRQPKRYHPVRSLPGHIDRRRDLLTLVEALLGVIRDEHHRDLRAPLRRHQLAVPVVAEPQRTTVQKDRRLHRQQAVEPFGDRGIRCGVRNEES